MICLQVMGLDTAVAMGGSGGHLQMNAYKPLIGFNLIHSIQLLQNACRNFRVGMIEGIQPNLDKIKENINASLMLVTALVPEVGYEKAALIAQLAHEKSISLKEAALELQFISETKFNQIVNPAAMTRKPA